MTVERVEATDQAYGSGGRLVRARGVGVLAVDDAGPLPVSQVGGGRMTAGR